MRRLNQTQRRLLVLAGRHELTDLTVQRREHGALRRLMDAGLLEWSPARREYIRTKMAAPKGKRLFYVGDFVSEVGRPGTCGMVSEAFQYKGARLYFVLWFKRTHTNGRGYRTSELQLVPSEVSHA